MAFAATDVPDRIDVLINGEGYMFSEQENVRAQLGITPTFVPRSNTQGDYGDNQQDFFFNFTQNDWSGGSGQKYFRRDDEKRKRYWLGENMNITVPGQATLGNALYTTTTSTRYTATPRGATSFYVLGPSGGNLYYHDTTSGETSVAAHGLGGDPECMTNDTDNLYFSNYSTGVGVRKYDIVANSFSTFSATKCVSLCYSANTLWGYDLTNWSVGYFSSAGAWTTAFQWKGGDGNAPTIGLTTLYGGKIVPFGGKVLFLKYWADSTRYLTGDLYLVDTTGASLVASLPAGFSVSDICVAYGAAFIAGANVGTDGRLKPAIYIYVNGSLELLWQAPYYGASIKGICPFSGGIAFNDYTYGLMYYDIATGAVSNLAEGNNGGTMVGGQGALHIVGGDNYIFPNPSAYATTGNLYTSLDDLDSSLTKIFRGITVEFEAGAYGSVDLAYQVGSLSGAYTSLATGITSGTEYTLSGVTGKSIAVKVTVNKGAAGDPSSATTPIIKKVNVRAVPKQTSYRKDTYVVAMGGVDGKSHQQLRDGTFHPNDGLTQATNLRAAAVAGVPITIVDQFGSYTGVIESDGLQIRCYRPEEFVAVVPVREV